MHGRENAEKIRLFIGLFTVTISKNGASGLHRWAEKLSEKYHMEFNVSLFEKVVNLKKILQ